MTGIDQCKISVTITLAQGSFAGTDSKNQVTLEGYRMAANIVKAGGNSQGSCEVSIYGLNLSVMNQLTTLGRTPVTQDTRNQVSISAGTFNTGMSVIFVGNIYQAFINLDGAPESSLDISAYAGLGAAMTAVTPSSYPGAVDAATIMESLATQDGLTFENSGASVMLHGAYFPGSLRSQMQACANAAGINWIIDQGKLAIWPRNGSRNGAIPLIDKNSGLIGYPYPSGQGLLGLRTRFNPQLTFGCKVQVDSSIKSAVGTWGINYLAHEISCEMPGGPWKTTMTLIPPGYLITSAA